MIPTPIERLQEGLTELELALKKSIEVWANSSIDSDLHEKHIKNLEPKIKEYKSAIAKLLE